MLRRPSTVLLVTSGLTGLLAYLTLILFARVAGEDAYAGFAVMWAAYYAMAGGLAGLQQEVTRAAATTPARPGRLRAGVLLTPLGIGTVVGAVAAASFPWWGRQVGNDVMVVVVLVLGAVGLSGLVTVLGLLASRRLWHLACLLLILDATVRVVIVAAVAENDGGRTAEMAAIVSGSIVWLPLLGWLAPRLHGLSLGPATRMVPRATAAMVTTGLAALLIAGYPALLAATSDGPLGSSAAGLLAAVVLFRSPVLLLVSAFRPLVLMHLLDPTTTAQRVVFAAWWRCAGGAVVAAAGAAALGPQLLHATMGDAFGVTRLQSAALVFSAGQLAMLTVSSLAFVAVDRHVIAAAGWLAATTVTIATLLLPLPLEDRVVASVLLGPILPLVLHAALLQAGRGASAVSQPAIPYEAP